MSFCSKFLNITNPQTPDHLQRAPQLSPSRVMLENCRTFQGFPYQWTTSLWLFVIFPNLAMLAGQMVGSMRFEKEIQIGLLESMSWACFSPHHWNHICTYVRNMNDIFVSLLWRKGHSWAWVFMCWWIEMNRDLGVMEADLQTGPDASVTLPLGLCAATSGVDWTALGLRHVKIPLEDLLVWHTAPLSPINNRPWLQHHWGLHSDCTAHCAQGGFWLEP